MKVTGCSLCPLVVKTACSLYLGASDVVYLMLVENVIKLITEIENDASISHANRRSLFVHIY